MAAVKNTRSYTLKVYGSKSKFEDLKWSAYQYAKLTNAFINHLYFNPDVRFFSTKGLGIIGNQAQQKGLAIVRSNKLKFHCKKCGHSDHADINAAINLSLKGQEHVSNILRKKSIRPIRTLSDTGLFSKNNPKGTHPWR